MTQLVPSLVRLKHLVERVCLDWDRQTLRVGVITDVAIILIVGVWVCFPFLGQNMRWGVHESRHALIAAEMADTGDFLVPHLLGAEYPDKPPVMHASAAVLYRLFGKVSMGLARTPSVLAAIFGAVALYCGARVLYGRKTGVFLGLSLLATWGYAEQARIARPDMIFGSAIFIASVLFLCAMARSENRLRAALFLAGGLTAGLGMLTKGPYGILFPLLAITLLPIGRMDLRRPRALEWGILGIATLIIPFSWAIPVYLRDNGHYLARVVFQRELAGAFEIEPYQSPFLYVGTGLVNLLPWSLFLPLVMRSFKRWIGPVLLMATMLVILSIVPARKAHYIVPWYPFALLVVGAAICETKSYFLLRTSRVVLITALVIMPFIMGVCRPQSKTKGVNHKCEFGERVLPHLTDGSYVIGGVAAEAIALQNYMHGKPLRICVVDCPKPDELESRVADCLKAGKPCFVTLRETNPPSGEPPLRGFETEVLLEYKPLDNARLLRVLRHR